MCTGRQLRGALWVGRAAEVGGCTGRQPRKRRAWVSGNEQGNAGTVMAQKCFLDVDLIQLSGLNGGRLKQNFNLKN